MTADNLNIEFLTRNELARRWRVSTETIKRRERAGILPVLKLGRRARYRLEDVTRIEAEAVVAR
ncbi:MAG TPA: hypothetical protein VIT23_07885 [Terrimicrobiaceae bacterium]